MPDAPSPSLLALALALLASPAAGQGGGGGLTASEASVGALGAFARREFTGIALGGARRIGSQTRVAALAAAGTLDGAGTTALRLEATAQFLVTPAARGGAGLYGGAGLAFQGVRGDAGAGYLLVLLGLEGAPGRPDGWYVEVGLGGGVRLAAGWRWRRFPGWWR